MTPVTALLTVALLPALVGAPSGDEILRRVDAQMESSQSQILTMDMAISDPGKDPRRIGLQMHMHGERRRIAFLYPGDMKGMRVLNLSPEQTYVYLPAFKKVRRVASHLREQTLFGSDYTFDDFGTLALHRHYTAEVTDEDDARWHLCAKPRQAGGGQHGRIALQVDKKQNTVAQLQFFDTTGALARTEYRSDFQCDASGCTPRKTKMVDHRRDNHWTEVTIKNLQLGTAIPEHIFSLRALQRSE